jgi:cytochrome c
MKNNRPQKSVPGSLYTKLLGITLAVLIINLLSAYTINPDPGPAPDPSRFKKVVITEPGKLDEPMEMTFLPGNRILIVERKGGVKIVDGKTGDVKLISTIPVNTKYKNKQGQVREAEEGLMGVIADPNFDQNHWVYLYYADPNENKHVLARWELIGDELKAASKKIMLEIPTQREECCHTGGGMTFDKSGNLFLTVGNNTVNPRSGTSNLDDRPGFENNDDQRAPGNTNDLRGKILRIHPENDGTYTIPDGNLFPKGTPKTRPEIYTMGHRNPWRVSIDSKTGFIYWGEVGPDASAESARGPRGYDEFNQAKGPGFFGWPYFIGNNIPYVEFHHQDSTYGKPFDPLHPANKSLNNTGLNELPPAQPAMIWYPYNMSDEFPLLGAAGRSATGGPVYHRSDFAKAVRPFPSYYEGKWLIVEFMRGWIMSVTMDENGNYKSMERFVPDLNFSSAIDMQFGPDGDLYVLEYGSAWFKGNENAHLTKIEYNDGNRSPVVNASATKTSGSTPLKTQLSSAGTKDFDKDALTYEWKIIGGGTTKILKEVNPSLTLVKPGTYKATLTVTDAQGAKSSKTIELKVGNEPPVVSFDLANANKTFYFPGTKLNYQVKVQDKEDGSIANGKIQPSQIAVSLDYMPLGYVVNKRSIGPSYLEIANRYKGKAGAVEMLAQKVIKGGVGVWGDHAMSAHPNLSVADARAIVEYILTTGEKKSNVKSAPVKGEYAIKTAADQKEKGTYVFRAAYRDKGTASMSPLVGEEIVMLRYPSLNPELADFTKGFNKFITPAKSLNMDGDGSFLAYKDIDMTGIDSVAIKVNGNMRGSSAGGVIEMRLDNENGTLIGKTSFINFAQRGQNRVLADIADAEGKHTLYFVFRNPNAKPGQTLLQPIEMEMISKK